MTIDGKIETVRKMQNQDTGEDYFLVHVMGRKFIVHDLELGMEMAESIGVYGRFTYSFFKGATPNTYLLMDWMKDGWK